MKQTPTVLLASVVIAVCIVFLIVLVIAVSCAIMAYIPEPWNFVAFGSLIFIGLIIGIYRHLIKDDEDDY